VLFRSLPAPEGDAAIGFPRYGKNRSIFPRYGRFSGDFSMLWKIYFHTMENVAGGLVLGVVRKLNK
jgi:hypothetical protein